MTKTLSPLRKGVFSVDQSCDVDMALFKRKESSEYIRKGYLQKDTASLC